MSTPQNPDNLTPEQVGVAEGWRLLDADEIVRPGSNSKPIPVEMWFSDKWDRGGLVSKTWRGNDAWKTYRTRLSRSELAAARELTVANEPEIITTGGVRRVVIGRVKFGADGFAIDDVPSEVGATQPGAVEEPNIVQQLERELFHETGGKSRAYDLAVEALAATDQQAERISELERSRNNWIESAKEFSNGLDFYRNLVTQIGDPFGVAAKTSDDGSVQQDVLALRVPELVAVMRSERDALAEQVRTLTEERGDLSARMSGAAGALSDARATIAQIQRELEEAKKNGEASDRLVHQYAKIAMDALPEPERGAHPIMSLVRSRSNAISQLASLQADKALVDFMEEMREECEGHVLTRCFMPSDQTLRQQLAEVIAARTAPDEEGAK